MLLRVGFEWAPSVCYQEPNTKALDPVGWGAYPSGVSKLPTDQALRSLALAAKGYVSEAYDGSKVVELHLELSKFEWSIATSLFQLLGIKDLGCQLNDEGGDHTARDYAKRMAMVGISDLVEPHRFYPVGMLMAGLFWGDPDNEYYRKSDYEAMKAVIPITVAVKRGDGDCHKIISVIDMASENIFLLMLIIYAVSFKGSWYSFRRKREATSTWEFLPLSGTRLVTGKDCYLRPEGSPYAKIADCVGRIISPSAQYMRYWLSLVLGEKLTALNEAGPILTVALGGMKASKVEASSPKAAQASKDLIEAMQKLGILTAEIAAKEIEELGKRKNRKESARAKAA